MKGEFYPMKTNICQMSLVSTASVLFRSFFERVFVWSLEMYSRFTQTANMSYACISILLNSRSRTLLRARTEYVHKNIITAARPSCLLFCLLTPSHTFVYATCMNLSVNWLKKHKISWYVFFIRHFSESCTKFLIVNSVNQSKRN